MYFFQQRLLLLCGKFGIMILIVGRYFFDLIFHIQEE